MLHDKMNDPADAGTPTGSKEKASTKTGNTIAPEEHKVNSLPARLVALKFAAQGLEVFPAPPGEKKSHKSAANSGGAKWGKTTDPEDIRRDWEKWPTANIGIATGAASGFWVIDLDVRSGGLEAWVELSSQHLPLPKTVKVLTPTGGEHYWWLWPADTEVRNSAGAVGSGIDVRGEGGMVIAPPSIKPGVGAYTFAAGCAPWEVDIAPAPDWLVDLVKEKPEELTTIVLPVDGGLLQRQALGRMAERLIPTEVAKVVEAAPGMRNDTLSRVAFTLGGLAGYLTDDKVRDALLAATTDWDDIDKTRSTIARQLAAGAAEPLSLSVGLDDLLLSHEDMAQALVEDGWATDNCYCYNWGEFLAWNGNVWRSRSDGEAMREIRGFLRRSTREIDAVAVAEADRIRQKQEGGSNSPNAPRSTRKVFARASQLSERLGAVSYDNALETKMQSEVGVPASAFDKEPLLLGTPNGVVDLRTGQMRPGRRDEMISKMTSVTPAPEGSRSQVWEGFLRDAHPNDQPMWEFLQRLAGYCLTGLTREERFFFFFGNGRNGKGTFLETLLAVMGDYGKVAPAGLFLANSKLNTENFLSEVDGARMIWGSEIDPGRAWDEAFLKGITGGDDVTAKRLYRDPYSFKPQATLIIAGNTKPSFRGVDQAMRSRVALVPFAQCFADNPDYSLKETLRGVEAPAILRWAVDGARLYLESGLNVPETVEAASRDYMDREDVLLCFVEEQCVKAEGAWTPTQELFARYRVWCDHQNIKAWGQRTFTSAMEERGWERSRRGKWGLKGIRLHSDLGEA